MTVTSAYPAASLRTYTGTGGEPNLDTVFPFYTNDQVVVISRVLATGVEVTLVEGTHYNVTGGSGSNGDVTPINMVPHPFPSTVEWEIKRVTPILQEIDLVVNVDLPSAAIEEQADRGIMSQQEIDFEVSGFQENVAVPNFLINGDMRVVEREIDAFANVDGEYIFDRWAVLMDTDLDVQVLATTSDVPVGAYQAMTINVAVNNRKFGIIQILEARDTARLKGGKASLSFSAKSTNSTLANIRAGILRWEGTADSPTLDVVDVWEDGTTNPTLIADWEYENTPIALTALTTAWSRHAISNIDISNDAENIAVFIWSQDTSTTVGDDLLITDVQLERGSVAHDFVHRTYGEELALCRRFYDRHKFDTAIGDEVIAMGRAITTSSGFCQFYFDVEKRKNIAAADVTLSPAVSYAVMDHNGSTVLLSISSLLASSRYINISFSVSGTPLTTNVPLMLKRDGTDDCEIIIDTEFN